MEFNAQATSFPNDTALWTRPCSYGLGGGRDGPRNNKRFKPSEQHRSRSGTEARPLP